MLVVMISIVRNAMVNSRFMMTVWMWMVVIVRVRFKVVFGVVATVVKIMCVEVVMWQVLGTMVVVCHWSQIHVWMVWMVKVRVVS